MALKDYDKESMPDACEHEGTKGKVLVPVAHFNLQANGSRVSNARLKFNIWREGSSKSDWSL